MRRGKLLAAALSLAAACCARPGAAQAPNETCETALELGCGDIDLQINTIGATNDFSVSSCTGQAQSDGPDLVWRLTLPPGGNAFLQFQEVSYDGAVYLVSDCGNIEASCVAGADCFPFPCANTLDYTNATGMPQTLYLIVDGYASTDQGVGLLTGTVSCSAPPQGACCEPAGGCLQRSEAACAAVGGTFQGAGTSCDPDPCPVVSRCIRPGVGVAADPPGDSSPADPQQDLVKVSIAEPWFADGIERIEFTIHTAGLDPEAPPPNATWRVYFVDTTGTDTTFFVSMNTCQATQLVEPAYDFGYVDEATNNLNRTIGTAEMGEMLPGGQIRIRMRKRVVASATVGQVLWHTPIGSTLTGIEATATRLAGANCSGLLVNVDATSVATEYRVTGNGYCRPHAASCPADLDVGPGSHLIEFAIDNPSSAARTFAVELSDGMGWLAGGPISTTVGPVPPGGSATYTATLDVPGDCTATEVDPITWSVTAPDLPAPDATRTCQTDATCVRSNAVDGLPRNLRLEVAGANPFRATTLLRYALPERARVRLEVFDVAGQRVRTLFDGEQPAGIHTAALDRRGKRSLVPGVYLVRLTAGAERRGVRVIALE